MGRRLKPLARSLPFTKIVITCEHATNAVPREFTHLFRSQAAKLALNSHRGWDAGAAPLARALARAFHAPIHLGKHTRLVADLNRSPGNRRGGITSEFMSRLTDIERAVLIDRLHAPHWHKIEDEIAHEIDAGGTVLHLGVHSFTPILRGTVRTADFAVLYDPRRPLEKSLCSRWLDCLADTPPARDEPPLRLRRNYPYLGTSDGLTTHLRKRFAWNRYAGIEIEINQSLVQRKIGTVSSAVTRAVIESLRRVLSN